MHNRKISSKNTLGEKLQSIQEGFLVEDVRFARWLGLSVKDYSTSRYKHSTKKPTKTWQNLLFAMRYLGTWWLPFAQYEPAEYEEIEQYRHDAKAKAERIDLFINQPIVNRSYSEVIVRLADALLAYRKSDEWTWDDSFCTIPDLAISLCIRLSERDIPKEIPEESTTFYDIQLMRMVRSLIELFGLQLVQRKMK